jgi:hypothetical protein
MKPDRFEILVCLSGIAVAALITTAAFGMVGHEPPIDSASNSGNASVAFFASVPRAAPNIRSAGPGFVRLSRESIFFLQSSPASATTPINIR